MASGSSSDEPSPVGIPLKLQQQLQPAIDYLDSDRIDLALPVLEEINRQWPNQPTVMRPLAEAYCSSGKYLPALVLYDKLIGMDATDALLWCKVGDALADVGEYAQAIGAFENCLELEPANYQARHNLARAQYRLGDLDAANVNLRLVVQRDNSLNAWTNLATMIPGCPQATQQEILETRREFVRQLQAEVGMSNSSPTTHTPRSSPQRLRVGYLSSFFHSANYMKPVWGLINHHDRSVIQTYLFNDGPSNIPLDGYQPQSDDKHFDTVELDNDSLAESILRCKIDILVDLNAYSVPERLSLFLQSPAPVTVAWFNMYATSALPGIQYLIGDHQVVRDEELEFYTERVIRLPVSYLTFEVRHPAPPVVPPPSLRNGYVTFGSLVAQYKITSVVMDAWAELLHKVPTSRLLLANTALKSPQNRQHILDQYAKRGIEPDRLILLGPAAHYDYLQYYDQIDIALDAFPYNGGTTTMEAIWQGVPVVTFDGDRWASRTSASLLRNSHLKEFVADDAEGYIQIAAVWATHMDAATRLQRLREEMRENLRQTSVCDVVTLAQSMEAIYQQLARR